MRVVAFGITLVGVSVVGLGVVHNLLAYLLINVVNGLASAICMGPMRTIIQTEADEKMVGRVFGLDTTLSTLGMPLGMLDRKSTRLNSSHSDRSRMPSSA